MAALINLVTSRVPVATPSLHVLEQAPYHRPPPLTLPTTPTPTASHAVQHSAPRAHTTSQPALTSSSAAAAGSALLPYHEALLQLMTSDLSPQRSGVMGDLPPPAGWLKQALCFGPPQLKPLLKEQQVRNGSGFDSYEGTEGTGAKGGGRGAEWVCTGQLWGAQEGSRGGGRGVRGSRCAMGVGGAVMRAQEGSGVGGLRALG